MPANRPRRLLRSSRACDFCHKRRIKCEGNFGVASRCQNCTDFDVQCTFDRPLRRGRNTPQSTRAVGQLGLPVPPESPRHVGKDKGQGTNGGVRASTSLHDDESTTEPLSPAWEAFASASSSVLKRLFSVYCETVYPIFPFFDPVSFQQRLDALEHTRNRAFFCSAMAACALASARIRDGAPASARAGAGAGREPAEMPPEIFFAAAEEALPKDILQCHDFDYLRGYALLALTSIQDAKIAAMHKYIGYYFTMLAINQWHDESNWPTGLHASEREERRRLYWSIYTLDVYSSIIWDGCIHFQESHARVEYPTGQTDLEDSSSSTEPAHWIVGWNFTTDLYRILEHTVSRLRCRSSRFNWLGDSATTGSFSVSSQVRVAELYAVLPDVFKHLQPATGDPERDIYGFQAANIQATMALLRMAYLSLDVDIDLEKKCSVVSDVLSTFHQVPKPYLRAISTPLIYHIGGIGIILGSVMEGPLSESSCRRVRDLLLSMAVLLESLEAFLHRSAGAGQRLRNLASRLEEYINLRSTTHPGQTAAVAGPSELQDALPSSGWEGSAGVADLSPQFQLPDDLFEDWTWPFVTTNGYLSF
ncbi:uncharacterized protein B0T15DRAFT_84948 [Chaetomium strumarium]|uniref:Zn(2)-C6 fungal-type domain-containing protein n=1 Tax=Chaetomium strumarium TaxID=1170767 RepID=A0AAJ0GX50_9PEZI|nr:hypothetical protein B0T15DRAFT_84948 [Chaetomium strumarium]